jgi:7,8-dihydropterin-6-yl-methyl-4-(beta-D-ribofuranosyl)aminobenzene 5'-phosphate synthase
MPTLRSVDTLTVDVLTDNVTDSYSSKPEHVTHEFENVMAAGAHELSGSTLCCAQLGLSLMLEVQANGTRHKLLFDAGVEGPILVRNCRNLGIRLDDVEAIAISHGHWDHMGALTAMLDEITRGARSVPCHVNPGMFVERGARLGDGRVAPFEQVPSPAELVRHGADVVNDGEERLLLDSCFLLSGEIPRVTLFERGRMDHVARRDPSQPWEPDPLLMDERYLAVDVRGRGLVVFSACSHAGIVNVLIHVRSAFPRLPILCVFGGLHLVGSLERIIPDTIEGIRSFDPVQIVPAHCTGFRAVHALLNAFGEPTVVPSAVGSRYSF